MKDLLRTSDLSRDDVELLLETTAKFAVTPLSASDQLRNKSVAIYMTKPSTRTRLASDRKSTRLNSSHSQQSRMPSSA